jgi:hypothetical protein
MAVLGICKLIGGAAHVAGAHAGAAHAAASGGAYFAPSTGYPYVTDPSGATYFVTDPSGSTYYVTDPSGSAYSQSYTPNPLNNPIVDRAVENFVGGQSKPPLERCACGAKFLKCPIHRCHCNSKTLKCRIHS